MVDEESRTSSISNTCFLLIRYCRRQNLTELVMLIVAQKFKKSRALTTEVCCQSGEWMRPTHTLGVLQECLLLLFLDTFSSVTSLFLCAALEDVKQ